MLSRWGMLRGGDRRGTVVCRCRLFRPALSDTPSIDIPRGAGRGPGVVAALDPRRPAVNPIGVGSAVVERGGVGRAGIRGTGGSACVWCEIHTASVAWTLFHAGQRHVFRGPWMFGWVGRVDCNPHHAGRWTWGKTGGCHGALESGPWRLR
jgi:hypothetical protein